MKYVERESQTRARLERSVSSQINDNCRITELFIGKFEIWLKCLILNFTKENQERKYFKFLTVRTSLIVSGKTSS